MASEVASSERSFTDIEWQRAPRLLLWAAKDFAQDNGPQWAAAVAYYALLSIFPLFLAALSIASLFVDADWAASQATSLMQSYLPTGQNQISEVVRGAFQARGGISLLSLALLLWSGSRVFAVATQALNIAFDADESYSYLKRTLVQFTLAGSVGLLFVVALVSRLVINLLWSNLPFLGSALSGLRTALTWMVPALLLLLALSLAYHFVPRRRVRWLAAVLGALLSTILFMIARPLFLAYIERIAEYNLIYGSLAIVVILVLWAWLVANIFLYGGEVASLVQAVLIEGRPREEVEAFHRQRSPVRKIQDTVEGKLGQGDKHGHGAAG